METVLVTRGRPIYRINRIESASVAGVGGMNNCFPINKELQNILHHGSDGNL